MWRTCDNCFQGVGDTEAEKLEQLNEAMGGTEESEEKVIEETQEHKKRLDEKQIVDLDKIVIKKREKKNEEIKSK